ncbi:MAG: CBS domain-containing protein [Planctomycetes bacterium]|nr:CBS domain-containing protein [Planctomycetota bacterium]
MDAKRPLLTAEQIMQRNVFTLDPDTQVLDAVQMLLAKCISGAPVVAEGKVVGMFSERDCLTVLAAAAYDAEPSGTVAQHMRREFRCIAPETDLFQISEFFHENPIRRLPVVDKHKKLVGLVSRGDVLRALQHVHFFVTKLAPPKSAYERIQEQLEVH